MIVRESMLVIGTAALLLAIIVAACLLFVAFYCFFTANYYGVAGSLVGFVLLCHLIHEMIETLREA